MNKHSDTPMSNKAIIYPGGDYYDDKVLVDDCRKIERMYNDVKFKLECIYSFCEKTDSELRLLGGEMTAQEIRTFRALFAAALRSREITKKINTATGYGLDERCMQEEIKNYHDL